MKYEPLISIITVCYNSEKTIEDTILSVLNQTYKKIEYIIIDGKSKDKTLLIIRKYERIFKERGIIYTWISEKDTGIYNAMNKGIELSNGKWIGIINSDDWYELDAIENVVLEINKNPKVKLIHGDMNIYKDERLVYINKPDKYLKKINKGMVINHPTIFVKKTIYDKYGMFDENFSIVSDWYFILKIYKHIKFCYLENTILSNFSEGGISSNFNIKQAKEKHLVRKRLNIYRFADIYYLYDLVKLYILGENNIDKIKFIKRKINFINEKF